MLMEMKVTEFTRELASKSPAPGGGSVSALAGSLAAALVAMVARLTATGADQEVMPHVLAEATALQASLQGHVDRDTDAFNRVMSAYRLPRQTQGEKQARSAAIQAALKGATDHPMQVAEECLRVLRLCREAAAAGNPNAISDAGVAALMAYSGITGAMFNVAVNLAGIKDQDYQEQAIGRRDRIMSEAAPLYSGIRVLLLEKMPHMARW